MKHCNYFRHYSLITLFLIEFHSLFANNSDSTLTNLFEMPIEELIEQEVTIATKSSQKVTQSPSVTSVITSEEIKALGFRELEEVLKNLPGFGFTQTRIGTKPFEIRGVSDIRQGGRLLIMVDGIPYNEAMHGSAVYYGATYNLDQIDRIEVIRGPGSALYGRNAFSGVVNIITKKATANNQYEIGASYGSFNTADIHAQYGIKNKHLDAFVALKYYTTDGTDSEFANGMGGLSTYNMTHDNFYLNGNAKYGDFQLYTSYSHFMDGTSPGLPVLIDDDTVSIMTDGNTIVNLSAYSLNYYKSITSKIKIGIKLYGRNENRIQNVERYKPNTTALNIKYKVPTMLLAPEGIYAKPVYDDYTYGGELELNAKLVKNNDLLIGVQGDFHGVKNATVRSNYDLTTSVPIKDSLGIYYSKDNMPEYEPGWIKNNGHNYRNAAIYIQDVHFLLPNLSFTIGGRLDYDSEVGVIFNPRLGMVWEPNKYLWLKLLYGQAYRAPTTNEQYKIMGLDKGNENLKYEKIKTSEMSFGTKTDRLYTQLSFYFNQLNNLILQQNVDTVSDIKSYFNSGNNISYGLEFESKLFLSKSIYSFFNYSYCHSEDSWELYGIKKESDHPNVAYHKLNSGINIQFIKYFNLGLFCNYTGPISKFKNLDGNYISRDKVGDVILVNSSFRLTNLIKGLDLALYGYNLLDKTYYFQDDQNRHQPSQPKIHFLFKATYSFN